MTLEIQADLIALQRQRERRSVEDGLKRFRNRTNLGSFQQRLFKDFLPPLIKAIDERKNEISNPCEGKQTTKPRLADFVLAALDSEEMSLITIVSVMHCLADSQQDMDNEGRRYAATMRRTALRIGQHCRDQFFSELSCEGADASSDIPLEARLRTVLLDRQKNPNATSRAESTIDAMKTEQWWSPQRMIAVGVELIYLAIQSTGLFAKGKKAVGTDSDNLSAILRLTDRGADWLAARRSDRKRHLEDVGMLSIPINLPMLVEPKPWIELKGGGYLTLRAALVKPNDENLVPDDFYDVHSMPEVTAAVDVLQRTGWEINSRLFENYKKCWDNDSYMAKFFKSAGLSKKELTASIEIKISTCEELLGKTFFFPYQLDFRGRVYPIPHAVNTQSDDATRSLLLFAKAQPVNEGSEYWTAIHTANAYGLNKLSLECRYQWCQDNWGRIECLADDPFRHIDFWSQAKEPWGFLAACYELVEIKRGATVTRLPIYVDGKCNGLQHLSAMSRDEDAGEKVNLTPSNEPQDIYDFIAQQVRALVEADANDSAKFWKGEINRDLVKRPVMTTPYGVTANGVWRQLRAASASENPDNVVIDYLAEKVVRAIDDTMHGPADVHSWLKSVAKELAKANQPIIWTTPSGFRVYQDYRKSKSRRVPIGKTTVEFRNPVNGNSERDKRKQATSLMANFVHSMDGAHLVKVVNQLNSAGVGDIGVVHDSFGVHACHVDAMNRIIREEFVRIYSEPVLDKFLREQTERTGVSLKAFSAYGDLAICDVLKSPYFFS